MSRQRGCNYRSCEIFSLFLSPWPHHSLISDSSPPPKTIFLHVYLFHLAGEDISEKPWGFCSFFSSSRKHMTVHLHRSPGQAGGSILLPVCASSDPAVQVARNLLIIAPLLDTPSSSLSRDADYYQCWHWWSVKFHLPHTLMQEFTKQIRPACKSALTIGADECMHSLHIYKRTLLRYD